MERETWCSRFFRSTARQIVAEKEREEDGERVSIDLDENGEDININNDILNFNNLNRQKDAVKNDKDPLNK